MLINNKAVLDTHAFIWLMPGSPELSAQSIKKIENYSHAQALYISAISLWEVAMLEKKREDYFTSTLFTMGRASS